MSYWRDCSSRTSGNARNQNVLGINDRHKKRIENRLKHVLVSSLCVSVRRAHQGQRGTADRNNCRAVVENPLVKKVKKKKKLSSALTINIYFNPCRKEKLYTWNSPKMWRNPMSATASATCIQLVSPGQFAIFAATLVICNLWMQRSTRRVFKPHWFGFAESLV